MRYLIFDTAKLAQDAADTIFNAAMLLYQAQGYTVTNNSLVGRSRGVDVPNAQTTTSWAKPVQRLDGKWIVRHPEAHPAGQVVMANGQLAITVIMDALGPVVEENYVDTWFPEQT